MKKFFIWISTIAVIVIGAVFVWRKFSKKGEKAVEIVEARIGTIEEIVSVTGTVKSSEDIDLAFKSTGRIVSISAKVGDKIETGQDLAGLETSDLDSSAMEAEAAVKVAEAQLEEAKAGSSEEEIKTRQIAVQNAEANLTKTRESAEKAILSAEAQVASQEVIVANKEQAMEDAQIDAENDLSAAYESALNIANSKYLTAYNASDVINDMFNDDDLTDILGNLNYQSKIDAEQAKLDVNSMLNAFQPYLDSANATESQNDIDSALGELRKALDSLDDSLATIYTALLNTRYMFNITEAELASYKTSISTERTNIDTAQASVISAQQTITSTKIANAANVNTAQQNIDSAKAALLQYQASLESTNASQQALVTLAEGNLESAKQQLESARSGSKQETIAVYEARVKQSKAVFASILNKYSDRTIVSPVNGIIAYVFKKEGENASAGERILSIIAESGMEIEIDIPESDIVKVSAGDSCDITLDAFPSNKIFKGTVASVYPAENIIEGVVYYKAKVVFNSEEENVKPGMTANIDILTDKKENVIIIPSRFIEEKGGKYFVNVQKTDGLVEEREIIRGLRGFSGEVEVVSGLEEGEKVVE